MLISIVIPLYNKRATILRAIESVRAQTWTQWQLIVVDDGSHDGGLELARQIEDPRIRTVRQPNRGVSAARNAGAALCGSGTIAFLDADDTWEPAHLATLAALIAQFPGAAVYGTAYRMVRAGTVPETRELRLAPEVRGGPGILATYFRDLVQLDQPFCSSTVAVPRASLAAVDGFPAGITAGEDLLTWVRLACLGPVAFAPVVTATYHLAEAAQSPDRIARPQKPDAMGRQLRALLRQNPRHAADLNRVLGHWKRIRSICFLERGERRDALRELGAAVACSGLELRDVAALGLLALPRSARRAALRISRRTRARADA